MCGKRERGRETSVDHVDYPLWRDEGVVEDNYERGERVLTGQLIGRSRGGIAEALSRRARFKFAVSRRGRTYGR